MNDHGRSPELLRLSEAAAIAKLSEKTIRRAMSDPVNPLRAYRFGRAVRFERGDLDKWIRAHASAPTVPQKVLDKLSPEAREIIKDLLGPQVSDSGDRAECGDMRRGNAGVIRNRTRKVRGMSARKSRENQRRNPLDCESDPSVHVLMDKTEMASGPKKAEAAEVEV